MSKACELASDESLVVRFQLALSLGACSDPRVAKTLAQLAKSSDDRDVLAATLVSAHSCAGDYLHQVIRERDWQATPAGQSVLAALVMQIKLQQRPADLAIVAKLLSPEQIDSLVSPAVATVIALGSFDSASEKQGPLAEAWRQALQQALPLAKQTLQSDASPSADRAIAVKLLALSDLSAAKELLIGELHGSHRSEVAPVLISALTQRSAPEVPQIMLAAWEQLDLAAKESAANLLCGHSAWANRLLDACEHEELTFAELPTRSTTALCNFPDEAVRKRALVLRGQAQPIDRQAAFKDYAQVLTHAGDAARGAKLFGQHCANCHQVEGEGYAIGPSLTSMANVLLVNVMVNRAISFKSAHFPGKRVTADEFDPLAYVIQQAHRRNMQVEAWCCVYYEGRHDSPAPALHPQWFVRSMSGHPLAQDFLSPAVPEVNDYLLAVISDLLNYDIDGIHLDYIRFPGTTFDYSLVGREQFHSSEGFDPSDFLDHADRIVDPACETYPIRVLFPNAHRDKAWETTHIERTLDQTGFGYAFVSESVERIAELQSPGLLIVPSYHEPAPELVAALAAYVTRGGDVLWIDVSSSSLHNSPSLRKLLGIQDSAWSGKQRLQLEAAALPTQPEFSTNSLSELTLNDAIVFATTSQGQVVAARRDERGTVLTLGLPVLKCNSPAAVSLTKSLLDWFRQRASGGEGGADPLAAKPAAWVEWRANRVTNLVRSIHQACEQKSPVVTVSSSGGPSRAELYSCYRDARRWLADGLNDRVFPMNYTTDPQEFAEILQVQRAATPAGKEQAVFPRVQIYQVAQDQGVTRVRSQATTVVQLQLRILQQQGYHGYALFAYNSLSDELLEVVREANSIPIAK